MASNAGVENRCGVGDCAGTVTFAGLCISSYHIDHILIMAYLSLVHSPRTARLLGRLQEDGGKNADTAMNDIVLRLLEESSLGVSLELGGGWVVILVKVN